ncbi:MAG: hypothetical protein K9L85_03975 [Candidatus Peribacteraceae bacterium]|nr:hypothetical protein [Candidatus Peribacteraceae bacterium]
MQPVTNTVKSLSRARQIVLVGSGLAVLSVFMPWHTIGTAVLGTENSYNGFGDQNLIIGIITLVFMVASLAIILLPLVGMRFPRTGWRESGMLIFFGGESALLLFVLTIMHATSLTRAANYDLRIGIHLALIGAALVFIGGYLLKNEEARNSITRSEPLAQMPRRPQFGSQIDLREETDDEKEDSRMRLDI